MEGKAAQGGRASQSQCIFLRARPRDGRVSQREVVRAAELGQRDGQEGPAGSARGHGADSGRKSPLSGPWRRGKLDGAVLQSADQAVLLSCARAVRRLLYVRALV